MKKTPPRFDCGPNNVSKLTQPSPTVSTKEAIDLVKQMWRRPDEDLKQPKSTSLGFQIYSDEKATPAHHAGTSSSGVPFPVFTDENAAPPSAGPAVTPDSNVKPSRPPFAIFSDDKENEVPSSSSKPRLTARQQGEEEKDDDSLKENVPPADYVRKQGPPPRQLSGVLQPSEGVPYVALEIQVREGRTDTAASASS